MKSFVLRRRFAPIILSWRDNEEYWQSEYNMNISKMVSTDGQNMSQERSKWLQMRLYVYSTPSGHPIHGDAAT
jgi:hypothetical protein